jgi:hypothetical protein
VSAMKSGSGQHGYSGALPLSRHSAPPRGHGLCDTCPGYDFEDACGGPRIRTSRICGLNQTGAIIRSSFSRSSYKGRFPTSGTWTFPALQRPSAIPGYGSRTGRETPYPTASRPGYRRRAGRAPKGGGVAEDHERQLALEHLENQPPLRSMAVLTSSPGELLGWPPPAATPNLRVRTWRPPTITSRLRVKVPRLATIASRLRMRTSRCAPTNPRMRVRASSLRELSGRRGRTAHPLEGDHEGEL